MNIFCWPTKLAMLGIAVADASLLAVPGWQLVFLCGVLIFGLGVGLGEWKGGE